ncbi:chemotaxis protein CheW [Comamonas terrigena]|uniref:chemotaxis protein CheW n=1 Tax=Comamonas terrigena TaxID=32013 RepID=UPI00244B46EE|nr:chemotaxis protein CheW [Comamonas terrigena]MDH0050834.1 chemotaxis protein CheW [Comamonas terrigena]MDH0513236.1 chemotaxis protein CheW [Comamonas terrigena]MDH1093231.1 chemotaxis protein CheW [Comamonas terrigena]MDH1292232.1 chemotaxis protein CheW [Comamonas terrigena]MDH1500647.1 chemotaxis protein CheW [Comamonas terrigena]
MVDTHTDAGGGADFDLTQFYQIFFEEAGENLDQMEQMLLNLDLSAANDEELNGIFRCAHSIKGGSATFGFSDVAELTHKMESLLDRLRRHEITPIPEMVDVLLESADASRSLLARHQAGGEGEALSTSDLVRRITELAAGNGAVPAPVAAPVVAVPVAPPPPAPAPVAAVPVGGTRALEIRIGPMDNLDLADAIKELFRDIPGLGTIEDLPCTDAGCRLFGVQTQSTDEDLLDLFAFHVAKEQVQIRGQASQVAPVAAAAAPQAVAVEAASAPVEAAAPLAADMVSGNFGIFPGAPGDPETRPALAPAKASAAAKPAVAATMESTSIRVALGKVDQLINLAGELVITQAMLAQNSRTLDPAANQQLLAGLADLDRNTRDLQECVMSIRMIPMSTVFSRFPRMLRDLANKMGKKFDLVLQGEATELDKGLVEKITDPLTHLVRNSLDHGIEMPEQRIAAGKSEAGTLTLAASHQGGSIVIEVRDDGRGMNREKILRKARERGMDVSDSLPDADVWQLIFAPGFSTADVVTDVSGRGVGMDVVKKNITALNGTVEIDSAEGVGMRVAIRLPLTLAIMDGMSVGVGQEVYILPLSSVVESFQVNPNDVNTVAQGSQLVKVRDEYMPVIAMEKTFRVPRAEGEKSSDIMVVVESDGSRVALLVDELLGQHQVVVKNLESNYRKVPNVSGATILGDGTVALILDTISMVNRARY